MAIIARASLVLAAFMPISASADSADVAQRLAYMLGSEEICGFHYRQVAVEKWIEDNVAPDDMDFLVQLDVFMDAVEYDSRSLGASELVARCAQVRRVGETNGFLKAE